MANKIVSAYEITGTNQFTTAVAVVKGASLRYHITKDAGVTAFTLIVQESFDGGSNWVQVYKANGNPVEFSSVISSSTTQQTYDQDTLIRFGIPTGGTFTGTGNIYITLRAG